MLNVLLGITGGISAFKATGVIRGFTEAGHTVKVVPTQNALRFIGAATLEALSHNTVDSDLFTDVDSVKHVKLGQEAQLVIVAPATAAFLARYANGVADDLLLNTLLVTKAPVVVAPAMHTEMWQHPATQQNVAVLRSRGVHVMEPDSGRLTGSDSGPGRLPTPNAIVQTALAVHSAQQTQQLTGKRVVITAGGTREPIDPVRFVGNLSSGKQGLALAYAAKAAGAHVTLIGANLEGASIDSASGIDDFIDVGTAEQLQTQLLEHIQNADFLFMAAAVSDFRVENPSASKIKRSESPSGLELKLVANPDILAGVVELVETRKLDCIVVGFAAETAGNPERLASLAAVKLAAKGCRVIVANDVTNGAVFGQDHNSIYLLSQKGQSQYASGTKLEVATQILKFVSNS